MVWMWDCRTPGQRASGASREQGTSTPPSQNPKAVCGLCWGSLLQQHPPTSTAFLPAARPALRLGVLHVACTRSPQSTEPVVNAAVRSPSFIRCGGDLFQFLNCLTLLGVCGPPNQGEHNRGSVAPWSASFGPRQHRVWGYVAARSPVRSLPSPRLGLAFWLPPSRILAAVWRPCESLWGRGIAGTFPGFDNKSRR
jgi:hypothetical protein